MLILHNRGDSTFQKELVEDGLGSTENRLREKSGPLWSTLQWE